MVLENSASWEPGHDISEHSELMPEIARGVPLIKVFGIGGGGSNAVARMYKEKLPVVEYYAVNTDAQHLFRCDVGHRLAIGQNLTRGLGSGALPDLGRQAATRRALIMVRIAVKKRCGMAGSSVDHANCSPRR